MVQAERFRHGEEAHVTCLPACFDGRCGHPLADRGQSLRDVALKVGVRVGHEKERPGYSPGLCR
jgi:hypothetical protein